MENLPEYVWIEYSIQYAHGASEPKVVRVSKEYLGDISNVKDYINQHHAHPAPWQEVLVKVVEPTKELLKEEIEAVRAKKLRIEREELSLWKKLENLK